MTTSSGSSGDSGGELRRWSTTRFVLALAAAVVTGWLVIIVVHDAPGWVLLSTGLVTAFVAPTASPRVFVRLRPYACFVAHYTVAMATGLGCGVVLTAACHTNNWAIAGTIAGEVCVLNVGTRVLNGIHNRLVEWSFKRKYGVL